MLRRRKSRSEETPKTSEAPPTESDGESQDADTVAHLLRSFGEHAFDLREMSAGEVRERCEAWARHTLVGTDPIGDEKSPDSGKRDWFGLRLFFSEHRAREGNFVRKTLGDLHEVIWSLVQGMSRSIARDRTTYTRMTEQLTRLQNAVATNSLDALKSEATGTVDLFEALLDEKTKRQEQELETLAQRLETLRGELDDARERMTRDGLTEIFNRAAFDEQTERVVDLGRLLKRPAILFMIDVDHFKWVNDTHGHPVGDQVLRTLAKCIEKSFLRKDDFVSRYGGEEFAVIIQEESLDIARRVGERLLHAVRSLEIPVGDETLRISVSVGATLLEPEDDAARWIERADRALYSAKQSGRDRLVIG